MKLVLRLMFVALFVQAATAQIPLTPGWYEMPNTKMAAVCQGDYNTCSPVVYAWNSGAMDTVRNRLIIWGGGHGDYGGNEIYALNLNGTPNFQRITNNTNIACGLESCDGGVTPNSRHTYDGIVGMPTIDSMLVYGGAASPGGNSLTGTWLFHFATNSWEKKTPTIIGANAPLNSLGCTLSYDPVSGKAFLNDNGSLYAYDAGADSWTKLTTGTYSEVNNDYHTTSVIDPIRHKFFRIGAGKISIADISGSGSYNSALFLTTGGDAVVNSSYPGLAYDPINDRIAAWIGGDTVYSLNVDSRVWTPITYTGGPGPSQPDGTYKRFSFLPSLGIFILENDTAQNAFALRLGSGGTTPPPDPVPPVIQPPADCWLSVCGFNFRGSVNQTTDGTGQAFVGGYSSTPFPTTLATGVIAGWDAGGSLHADNLDSSIDPRFAGRVYVDPNFTRTFAVTLPSTGQYEIGLANGNTAGGDQGRQDFEFFDGAISLGTMTAPSVTVDSYNDATGISRTESAWPASNVSITKTFSTTTFGMKVGKSGSAYVVLAHLYIKKAGGAIPPPSVITIRTVGPGKMYAALCAAIAAVQNGDSILVDAGTYSNESCALNKNDVTIQSIGGLALLKWDTGDYQTATNLIANGKAILVIQGNNTTIDGLGFSGAKVADENGAGIRYEGGNLTILNSYFTLNQNGILGQGSAGSTLLVDGTTFTKNGFCGSACAHNIYIGSMDRFIFRNSRSLDPLSGSHALKSRARINEVINNKFSTLNSDGSLEAEFPNGGVVYFTGNQIEQGANTSNSTVLGYGLEGATNPDKRLYVTDNVFINRRTAGATFVQTSGSPTTKYSGNTFIGPGTVPSGMDSSNTVAP